MPEIKYEIRVAKILRPLIGATSQEILYLAKPTTAPDPGALIATFNPTLVLPLPPPPPPILLEGQATVDVEASSSEGQVLSASTITPEPNRKSWWRG